MSGELCFTENPEFYLIKEYETKPDINDLFDLFIVVYLIDVPNWKKTVDEDEDLKAASRYIIFSKLEKAFKRFKLFGPGRAVLKRIITDNEELYQAAKRNDDIIVKVEEEEEKEEEKKESTEV